MKCDRDRICSRKKGGLGDWILESKMEEWNDANEDKGGDLKPNWQLNGGRQRECGDFFF